MSNSEIDKFAAMEALDESQIVEEIKGHVIEKYFYEFGNVTGISYAGIKWMKMRMANQGYPITIESIEKEENADEIIYTVAAKYMFSNEVMYGVSSCPKLMTMKDGTTKPDPFARQKALSKAQRNAIRNFIPEIAIQEGYKEWKKGPNAIERVFAGRLDGQTK